MIHILKTWPLFFEAVKDGKKQFEIRFDDRGYAAGDHLVLREYDPEKNKYTGEAIIVGVTWVIGITQGLQSGYVVMSLGKIIIADTVSEPSGVTEAMISDDAGEDV